MIYSADTSSFIGGWNSYYPYPVFPRIWDQWFVELIGRDSFAASLSVYDELKIGGDPLFNWCDARKVAIFREDDAAVQARVTDIQTNWPNSGTDFTRRLTGADSFLSRMQLLAKASSFLTRNFLAICSTRESRTRADT